MEISKNAIRARKIFSVIDIIMGGGMAVAFGGGTLFAFRGMGEGVQLFSALIGLVFTIAGIMFLRYGLVLKQQLKVLQQYESIINGRNCRTIPDIASLTGKSPTYIVNELEKYIKLGLITNLRIDHENKTLIFS